FREMFTCHTSIPAEVTGCPGPVICPDVASIGNAHARICCDSLVNATFFPSGETEISVFSPGEVVKRSRSVACKDCGSTVIRQIFLAPRKVRSKKIAWPDGDQPNLKSILHSTIPSPAERASISFCSFGGKRDSTDWVPSLEAVKNFGGGTDE